MKNTLILAFLAIFTFTSNGCIETRHEVDPTANLTSYKYVAVYDSDEASFLELHLEGIFRELGFEPVGDKEAERFKKGECFGVRYVWSIEGRKILLLEDFATGKTLVSCLVRGMSSPDRIAAKFHAELAMALGKPVPERRKKRRASNPN